MDLVDGADGGIADSDTRMGSLASAEVESETRFGDIG